MVSNCLQFVLTDAFSFNSTQICKNFFPTLGPTLKKSIFNQNSLFSIYIFIRTLIKFPFYNYNFTKRLLLCGRKVPLPAINENNLPFLEYKWEKSFWMLNVYIEGRAINSFRACSSVDECQRREKEREEKRGKT